MDSPLLVDDSAALARLAGELAGERLVAIDTEADSLHSYRGKLCLIQISTRERTVLVDPLALHDLGPLGRIFADPAVVTVLHGADYDVRVLHRDAGIEVRGLFDTMVAARLLGRSRFGLAALVEEEFGFVMDKAHQLADWARRPLTPEMVRYACDDTRHLPELHDRLAAALEAAGRRSWAEEEFRLLEAVRHGPEPAEDEAWRRVRGAGRLDRASQAVLQVCFAWREGEARKADRPPFKILGREALLDLARAKPRSRDELARLKGLPRRMRGRAADALLAAIAAGVAAGPVKALPRNARPARDPAVDSALTRAKRARDERARTLGLEPGMLFPNGVLERVVRAARGGAEDPFAIEGLRGWQRDQIADVVRPTLPEPEPPVETGEGRRGGRGPEG